MRLVASSYITVHGFRFRYAVGVVNSYRNLQPILVPGGQVGYSVRKGKVGIVYNLSGPSVLVRIAAAGILHLQHNIGLDSAGTRLSGNNQVTICRVVVNI